MRIFWMAKLFPRSCGRYRRFWHLEDWMRVLPIRDLKLDRFILRLERRTVGWKGRSFTISADSEVLLSPPISRLLFIFELEDGRHWDMALSWKDRWWTQKTRSQASTDYQVQPCRRCFRSCSTISKQKLLSNSISWVRFLLIKEFQKEISLSGLWRLTDPQLVAPSSASSLSFAVTVLIDAYFTFYPWWLDAVRQNYRHGVPEANNPYWNRSRKEASREARNDFQGWVQEELKTLVGVFGSC